MTVTCIRPRTRISTLRVIAHKSQSSHSTFLNTLVTLIFVGIITRMGESRCICLAVVVLALTLYRVDDSIGLCMFVCVIGISLYFVLYGL